MQTSLEVSQLSALAGILIAGALLPGVSVWAVSARALSGGFAHGAAVAAGVVAGDLVLILVAIYGLSLLADWLGQYFLLVRYLGGVYLIALGIALWRGRAVSGGADQAAAGSLGGSFFIGLAVTLADQKALLFYLAFLPGFLNLTTLTWMDTVTVLLTATVAVGVPKLVYAYGAARGAQWFPGRAAGPALRGLVGMVLGAVGLYLILAR